MLLSNPNLLAAICFMLLVFLSVAVIFAVAYYRRWSDECDRNDGILARLRRARDLHEAQLLKYEERNPKESDMTHWAFVDLYAAADHHARMNTDPVRGCPVPRDQHGRHLNNEVIRAIRRFETLNPHHLHVTATVDILNAVEAAREHATATVATPGKMPEPSMN